MLNKDHYKILESLFTIKKHNSNRKNIPYKFQASKYKQSDIEHLEQKRYITTKLLTGEVVITPAGEYALNNKF